MGNDAIRFSSSPALGGTATVVEIKPDKQQLYLVTVSYLEGHPSLGWDKWGGFHFLINSEDFNWLLQKIEAAERDGASRDSLTEGVDIVVCADGLGYLSEIRSKRKSRWISGFCGSNPNNTIALLMARLVRYGTSTFLKSLERSPSVRLQDEPDLPSDAK